MKKRVKVSEWWEVWWVKRGAKPIRMRDYGHASDPRISQEGFPTKKAAQRVIGDAKNKYLRLIHVVRYRRVR